MSSKHSPAPAFEDTALPTGRRLQAIENLVKLSATLFECASAVLLFNQAGVSRVICGHGQTEATQHMSYRWDYKDAPYRPDQRYIVTDARHNEFLQTHSPYAKGPIGFLIRSPVGTTSEHTFTLIVYDAHPHSAPGPHELHLLDEIVQLIDEELADFVPLFADRSAHVSVALTYDELVLRTHALSTPAALLDRSKTLVAANEALTTLLGKPEASLQGVAAGKISPKLAEVFDLFFERAFLDYVSSPSIEYALEATEGHEAKSFSIVATPLSPVGTCDDFLLVTASDITKRVAREERLDDNLPKSVHRPREQPEPSAILLTDTLVKRRAIRSRNEISYVTVRTWRSSLKTYQIAALKALKQRVPHSFAEAVAQEIGESVNSLVGAAAFKSIVPVPCGHSDTEDCLSVAIAQSLSAYFNLPMIRALASPRRKGSSHPKTNVTRPAMSVACAVIGPVLLVDDVATSGAHLQEAVELLRPYCSSVFPIAWIGGEVS